MTNKCALLGVCGWGLDVMAEADAFASKRQPYGTNHVFSLKTMVGKSKTTKTITSKVAKHKTQFIINDLIGLQVFSLPLIYIYF